MGIDACKVGLCKLYDGDNSAFALMLGIIIGVAFVLVVQYVMKRRNKK